MLIQPIPRRVPPEFRRAAGRASAASSLTPIGVVLGCFGAFFVWMFFPWNFYQDWQLLDAPTAAGRIVSVDQTGLRINRVRVFRYDFEFAPPGGTRTQGTSFTTGSQWGKGSPVAVRYRPENPSVCCIDGARSSQSPGGAALVLLLPAAGLVLVGAGVRARRRLQFLLESGRVAKARVLSVEETSVRINQQRVCRIQLQRLDPGAGGPITLRKYEAGEVALARARLASAEPVIVLYDPSHPERMLLPEALVQETK